MEYKILTTNKEGYYYLINSEKKKFKLFLGGSSLSLLMIETKGNTYEEIADNIMKQFDVGKFLESIWQKINQIDNLTIEITTRDYRCNETILGSTEDLKKFVTIFVN
jgi:hypothetical protein